MTINSVAIRAAFLMKLATEPNSRNRAASGSDVVPVSSGKGRECLISGISWAISLAPEPSSTSC